MKKIAVAITGASGSIYARQLLQKLDSLKDQVQELSIVMTDNAKEVWKTELDDENYGSFNARYFSTKDFKAPFASYMIELLLTNNSQFRFVLFLS